MTVRTTLTQPHPVEALRERGIAMPSPAAVYVDRTVDLQRLHAGATLCPGTRISGASTYIGSGALIGSEGPATLVDCAFDADSEMCSGFAQGAVLFRGAKIGGSAHVRPATILEEGASTAHAVGLKQTVLMSFATLGSLINACDLLISGGTSKDDHSEVGSGFIHFNFTPWGARGDKATPSLVGNVHEGVFLDRSRVFVGGLSGMVGPVEVGFGSVTAAGQVVRRSVGADRLVGSATPSIDRERPAAMPPNRGKLRANCHYIGQLCALRAWYVHIRLARRARVAVTTDVQREVLLCGVRALDQMIAERLARLAQYAPDNTLEADSFVPDVDTASAIATALLDHRPDLPHLEWVRTLPADLVEPGVAWLRGVGEAAARRVGARFAAFD